MEPPVSAYVQRADGDTVQVMLLDDGPRTALRALGFRGDGPALQRDTDGDADKAQLFLALTVLGIAFAAGREWSPAEVFAWLRERGLLAGPFLRIAWLGPAQFQITRQ
ncbi:hypothetical protein [Stenotrophomonas sp.]|uniref:hypothetical protein n=1 Tax=Stenotrophomonas sp. TaxID=69392 RepID=UPI002D633EC5|nr:hypothetical protein [Stenotrophomonas sp.]HYQ22727.1 hypothetical protein [Stenotrophomonas sp.]